MGNFEIQFRNGDDESGGIHLLELGGEFDTNAVNEFEEIATKVVDSSRFNLMLDLEQLNYVSSAGIGAMMALLHETRRRDGDVVLVKPRSRVTDILDVLGLTKIFRIAQSRGDAVALLMEPSSG